MAGVRLTYKIDDAAALAAIQQLESFKAHAMFDEIGNYLDSSVTQRFNTGVGPDGERWVESERAKNKGGKTLVDFGNLRDKITHNVFIDGTGVEHGSDMVYAAIHQFGGKTGRNKATTIIARPFVGIDADDEAEINAIVSDFIGEVLQ